MKKTEKLIKSMDLIKESWQVYAKNLMKFIEVFIYGLMGVLPMFGVLIVTVLYARFIGVNAPEWSNIILGLIAFVAFAISVYIAIVYGIRSKVASILLLKNNFTSAKENFKESKPYFVKFLGVSMLLVVLVIAWGFALFIPALIFAIYYGFAQFTLVVDGKRPFSAIEHSYDLVRGYWWPVFGRLCLVSVMGIIVYLIISAPLNGMSEGGAAAMIYSIFVDVIWVILSPYFLIYSFKVYESLKKTNK